MKYTLFICWAATGILLGCSNRTPFQTDILVLHDDCKTNISVVGESLYCWEYVRDSAGDDSPSYYRLVNFPTDGTGEIVALSSEQLEPNSYTVRGDMAYWLTLTDEAPNGDQNYDIMSQNVAQDNAPTRHDGGYKNACAMTADASSIYWGAPSATDDGWKVYAHRMAEASTVLLATLDSNSRACNMVQDPHHLYVYQINIGVVWKVAKDGSGRARLFSPPSASVNIFDSEYLGLAIDTEFNLYFPTETQTIDDPGQSYIARLSTTSGAANHILDIDSGFEGLTVGNGKIAWIEQKIAISISPDASASPERSIQLANRDGSNPMKALGDGEHRGLAVDDTAVYVVSGDALLRIPH